MVEVNSESGRTAWALSVHDKLDSGQMIDIRHIVKALAHHVDKYVWAIAYLDCMGNGTDEICDAVATGAEHGSMVVLNAEELRGLAGAITQTIDARIYGVPRGKPDVQEAMRMAESGHFIQSEAAVMIYVADNSVYVLVTKERPHIDALIGQFSQTRIEDPNDFC